MSRQNMFYWQSDRPYSVEEIKEIFLARKDNYSRVDMIKAAEHASGEPIAELQDPINHGSVNIVSPFITKSGRQGIVRAHPQQVKNEYFFAEREAMKAAKSVGVLVPDTWLVDDSRSVVPFDYMVMSRVKGKVLKDAVASNPSLHQILLIDLGRQLGKIHQYKSTGFGFFDNEKAKAGELVGIRARNQDHFTAALDLDEEFHRANSQYLGLDLINKSFDLLKKNIDTAQCDHPTIVHNDIADWNTVVDGDKVTGILDWDECFSGDPVFDFATMSLFYTDEQMSHIIKGYDETNRLPVDYQSKFNLYVARYVISKSKIAIKQLNSRQNDFMQSWLANAVNKLKEIVK